MTIEEIIRQRFPLILEKMKKKSRFATDDLKKHDHKGKIVVVPFGSQFELQVNGKPTPALYMRASINWSRYDDMESDNYKLVYANAAIESAIKQHDLSFDYRLRTVRRIAVDLDYNYKLQETASTRVTSSTMSLSISSLYVDM